MLNSTKLLLVPKMKMKKNEEMMMMNNLYKSILIAATNGDVSSFLPWDEYKIQHPNVSKEDYDELKELMLEESFEAYAEDVVYSLDKETAIQLISNNCGDMRNEGYFNYGVILETPLDTIYPDKSAEVVGCFIYNPSTDCYDAINADYNEEIKIITQRIIPE